MSEKVAIVTDSTAYFEPGEVEELGIHVVPLKIRLGTEKFLDGSETDTEELFRKANLSGQFPVSYPPDPAEFERVYADIHKHKTDQILSIHISSHLSKTIDRAKSGAEALMGRCSIMIVDSMTTSVGLGILVKAAARAANEGASLDDIVRLVRGMLPHIYLIFYVETMDYLERSGRIGKAQAILGSMLSIKPILFMEDGDIIPLEKVRTTEKALEKLFEFVAEFDNLEQTAIIQRSKEPSKEAKILKERLEQSFPELQFPVIQYGADMATRIGPNAVGIVVYEGMNF
ncbi:MAG: DegV family protein [Anaerolineae bacterium]|nr:DegV family protein [Anaerolineae bacterium]